MSLKFLAQIFNRRAAVNWETFEVEILLGNFLHKTESLQTELPCSLALWERFCDLETTLNLTEVI